MTTSGTRFSGLISGNPPQSLASGASTLNDLALELWTLGIELTGQQWLPEWSPSRDEMTRSSRDRRYQQSVRARRESLRRAVAEFKSELVRARARARALEEAQAAGLTWGADMGCTFIKGS